MCASATLSKILLAGNKATFWESLSWKKGHFEYLKGLSVKPPVFKENSNQLFAKNGKSNEFILTIVIVATLPLSLMSICWESPKFCLAERAEQN